ncbi:hypothetical protein G4B88_001372, partial [Cannabis sativa]
FLILIQPPLHCNGSQLILSNIPKFNRRFMMRIKRLKKRRTLKFKREEDLQKMSYLKAVILEGLRRHFLVHFVLPHVVSEAVVVGGHLVPKNGNTNFMLLRWVGLHWCGRTLCSLSQKGLLMVMVVRLSLI